MDLATPEEIVRLASGQSLQGDDQMKAERAAFSQLSKQEQVMQVNTTTTETLQALDYTILPQQEWFRSYNLSYRKPLEAFWKKEGWTALTICVHPCLDTLTLRDMDRIAGFNWLYGYSAAWDNVPTTNKRLTRRRIRSVRRVCLVPVLRAVPKNRIAQAFPAFRQAGSSAHYYRSDLGKDYYAGSRRTTISSSSEILIVDKIGSLSEYKEFLGRALVSMEGETATIIKL